MMWVYELFRVHRVVTPRYASTSESLDACALTQGQDIPLQSYSENYNNGPEKALVPLNEKMHDTGFVNREETAINIAVACQLLWTEAKMHRTVINLRGTGESETDEIKQALEGKPTSVPLEFRLRSRRMFVCR